MAANRCEYAKHAAKHAHEQNTPGIINEIMPADVNALGVEKWKYGAQTEKI
jgi:hypothetical protein